MKMKESIDVTFPRWLDFQIWYCWALIYQAYRKKHIPGKKTDLQSHGLGIIYFTRFKSIPWKGWLSFLVLFRIIIILMRVEKLKCKLLLFIFHQYWIRVIHLRVDFQSTSRLSYTPIHAAILKHYNGYCNLKRSEQLNIETREVGCVCACARTTTLNMDSSNGGSECFSRSSRHFKYSADMQFLH